jgi:hypothetical protein
MDAQIKQSIEETMKLKSFLKQQDIDIFGIADLSKLDDMPVGISNWKDELFRNYKFAIVLGLQLGK